MKLELDSLNKLKSAFSGSQNALIFEKGDVVYVSQQKLKFFYIVNVGKVGLFEDRKGRLISLDVVEAGSFLCADSLFHDDVLDHVAIALEKTEVLKIKIEDMKKMLNTCPDWVGEIVRTIWNRLDTSRKVLKEHQIDDEIGTKIQLDKQMQQIFREAIDNFNA